MRPFCLAMALAMAFSVVVFTDPLKSTGTLAGGLAGIIYAVLYVGIAIKEKK